MVNQVTIIASYIAVTSARVTLPDQRVWDDVAKWTVRWNVLHIIFKDGTSFEHDMGEPMGADTKRPDEVAVYAGENIEGDALITQYF